jgi:conjugal transfer mating pair stabilization protein TraN
VKTGGKSQCSPIACQDISLNPDTLSDLTALRDNGVVAPSGSCEGNVKVFNGTPSECRVEGLSTGYHNCCREGSDSILQDTQVCTDGETILTSKRAGGACHYVGEYCKKISIFGCLQKAKMFCCFGSKLGRIVHEQGRPQLKEYAANNLWGTAQEPFCNGLSPEQLSLLDFNQMDLTEFVSELKTDPDMDAVEGGIRDFFQTVTP